MEFEDIFIRVNEIIHTSIARHKEEIVGQRKYADVTVSHLFYLEAIHHLKNPTLTELAAHLNVSKASATVGVRKLIDGGLAVKVRSQEDRRVHYIHLRDKGMKLIKAEVRAFSGFVDNIKKVLTDKEIRQLERIFSKIIDNFGT